MKKSATDWPFEYRSEAPIQYNHLDNYEARMTRRDKGSTRGRESLLRSISRSGGGGNNSAYSHGDRTNRQQRTADFQAWLDVEE